MITLNHQIIDWDQIDTAIFDMDGTILDLRYDNEFWLETMPAHYAKRQGMPVEVAMQDLRDRYDRVKGTMQWYCIDYWSEQLGFDILSLKRAASDKIALRQGAMEFLQALHTADKNLVLFTNAHPGILQIKLEKYDFGQFFDAVISSHTIGAPKEMTACWDGLSERIQFDKSRSAFFDDSTSVLKAARNYGIKAVVEITEPDSTLPAKQPDTDFHIGQFSELMM